MYAQKQSQRKYRRLASRLVPGLLVLVLLVGCGGTASSPRGTPTPRVTASSTPGITPPVSQSPTPSPVATNEPPPPTATPVPTRIPTPTPTPRPTPSPCDTPPGVQPVSPVEIDIGNTSRPRIALMFDAGGPAEPTSRILDILAKHGVHVTFFITGDWANQNPALVRRIYAEGHEIGNHTPDWQATATSASITNIVMNHLSNGTLVLMHAGSQVESETLDGLMTKIEQKGFQIVSVSQVLQ